MIQDIGVLLVSRPGPGPLGRLPLEGVGGRPLTERLLQQVRAWDRVRRGRVERHRSLHGAIALAATESRDDDDLCAWADSIDLPFVRSSASDTASRVADASELAGFTWVAPIDPRDALVDVRGLEAAAQHARVGIDLITSRDALGIATWPVEIVRTAAIDAHAVGSLGADGLWGVDLDRSRDVHASDPNVDARIRGEDDLARIREFDAQESPDWSTITPAMISRWFGAARTGERDTSSETVRRAA